jgi:cobalt-zinc-cadmium efflux system membrane fusion protein
MFSLFKIQSIANTICISVSILFLLSCGSDSNQKDIPASVKNPVKESELTTIVLSEKAEQRLGVETALVQLKSVPKILKSSGEVIAIPGRQISVVAPVTGIIQYKNKLNETLAGKRVKRGQEVMKIILMPPDKDPFSVQENVIVKQAEFDVAKAKALRAEQLYKDKVISEKLLQESRAGFAAARGALNAAKANLQLLTSASLDSIEDGLSTLTLESPIDGVLQRIFVAPGQTVPISTPLFEVAGQNTVWIRIPVYVGNLASIDRTKNATVLPLGKNKENHVAYATPVQGPPLSDIGGVTSDLYYELDNNDRIFLVGQKVMVTVTQISEQEYYTIPYSSILYDVNGGTWVYYKIGPQTYSRRRVEISHIQDNMAVLTRGLSSGDEVVITAVAEIYGTEFGGSK